MSDELKPTPDQLAAQQLLAELRTRISTQRLPYQHGRATRALESMWEVFVQARDAIKKNPGCEKFADLTTHMLNLVVRPLTAKWDQAYAEGRLNGHDGSDQFRGDLLRVQEKLREFAAELHQMAYRRPHTDALTPLAISLHEIDNLFRPLAFGFTAHVPKISGVSEDIRKDEAAAVRARRALVAREDGNTSALTETDAIGVALSGGGIRSATFSLGVVQVLAAKGFFKDVDFLSTVSGGGYVGSFLTQQIGTGGKWEDVAAPHGPDTEPIRRLRQRAKFLTARNLWDAWGKVTATVVGMLMNWMVPLLVIVVIAALALQFHGLEQDWRFWRWPATIGIGLSIIVGIAYFGLLRVGSVLANRSGWCLALSVALGLLAFGAWGIGSIYHALFGSGDQSAVPGAAQSRPSWLGLTGLSLGGVAALIPVILRYIPLLEAPKVRRVVMRIALYVAGIFMPLLGITVFFFLYKAGGVPEVTWLSFAGHGVSGSQALWIFAALLTLLAIFFLNINLTGPHRLYRNALSKAFVERDETKDVDFPLADINLQNRAPYHLINAAVNLPSSKAAGLRDRKCDFFCFSRDWSGSPVVGYGPTKEWMMNGKSSDLATAMAISGAAFSSNMGLGSIAPLRALLAFLNVRLGFWIRKPQTAGLWMLPKWKHPGFMCLLREMGGFGMAEHHRWLNLSDGGHIENLGVYELLRRRCKLIICVDGESDPAFTFQGLMTLVRHAQIDFGVRIDARLDDLRRDPQTGYTRSHFHLCRIDYPMTTVSGRNSPAGQGLLLYIKLSLTGDESELIKRYRINNPEFPHQTTLDQFFDQEQFEAYRQLGVHAAEALFLPALMNQTSPGSVPQWFRQLAENLLEPTA